VRFSTRALGSMAGIERTKAELMETGGMRMGAFQVQILLYRHQALKPEWELVALNVSLCKNALSQPTNSQTRCRFMTLTVRLSGLSHVDPEAVQRAS
jgi:hypothetical protein